METTVEDIKDGKLVSAVEARERNLEDPLVHDDDGNIEEPPLKDGNYGSNHSPLTQQSFPHVLLPISVMRIVYEYWILYFSQGKKQVGVLDGHFTRIMFYDEEYNFILIHSFTLGFALDHWYFFNN
nr:hypothetical protein Iba_chr06dCG8760 [Ipomoea batatas]